MDRNGMNVILNATAGQTRMLEQKLTPGRAYPFLLALGDAFRPAAVVAYLRPAGGGYQLRLADPVEYRGRDPQFLALAEHGEWDTPTLDGLFGLIRDQFGGAAEPVPLQPVRPSPSPSETLVAVSLPSPAAVRPKPTDPVPLPRKEQP